MLRKYINVCSHFAGKCKAGPTFQTCILLGFLSTALSCFRLQARMIFLAVLATLVWIVVLASSGDEMNPKISQTQVYLVELWMGMEKRQDKLCTQCLGLKGNGERKKNGNTAGLDFVYRVEGLRLHAFIQLVNELFSQRGCSLVRTTSLDGTLFFRRHICLRT